MTQPTAALGEGVRALRRDAAENREKVLLAAAAVFAERGLEGSVDEVARIAGVGMGTIYRRFATKQVLIDELVGDLRRRLLLVAKAAQQVPDGGGLEDLLVGAGELQASELGCLQALWNHSDAERESTLTFRAVLQELLESAQQHGRVRADIATTDISILLWSVRGVIETTRRVAPDAWRRHLELLIAGLRPVTNGEFCAPFVQPQITKAQVLEIADGPVKARQNA